MQGTVGAILIVLALGLVLRLILAYLLPGSGFDADLASFRFWASNLATEGPHGFYERPFFHDYTPGYLYVLWLVGIVGNALGGIGDLIKIPPVIADLALGYLAWSMVRELGGRDRLALLAGAVVMVNPVFWFDNVVWGQVDSVGVVFLVLGLRALWRDRPERAAIYTVIAALIKPQLGILVPLVAVVTIRRALWPIDRGPVEADRAASPPLTTSGLERLRALERRTGNPLRIVSTGLAGFLTAVVLCAPFGLSVIELTPEAPFLASGLIEQIVLAGGGYPYLTVNAYNVWALVPGDLGNSLVSSGQWICDAAAIPVGRCGAGIAQYGPVPAVAIGTVLLLAVIASVLWIAARRPDRLTLLVALAVIALAFYAVPTRVHERYGFPFFALGAILLAVSPRWRVAYVVLSLATLANMYVVLTTLYPPADPALNPVRDWLGIGEALRSPLGVGVIALLHTAGFAWVWLQLRSGAHERLEEEAWAASRAAPAPEPDLPASPVPPPPDRFEPDLRPTDPRPAAAAEGAVLVAPATWTEPRTFEEAGWLGWIRDRMGERPVRADRSHLLVGEHGGRLDRLDAWFLVVIVIATLGMRTFRLAEPYQMHFDEVYHARTATEFLQGWRYGESHDIYEWTHPHLAKYLMAAGLVAWGGDHVEALSDLGTPIRAAAIEHRRSDPLTGERLGERVHLVTDDGIRSEDLRSRATVGRIAAPGARTVVVDAARERLIIGFDDGALATVDLLAIGLDGPDGGPEPIPLTTVDHPVTHLHVTDDGATVVAASAETVSVVDAEGARVLGSSSLPGIADIAEGGTGASLVADPRAIDDPAAVAEVVAELIGGDAADYETRLLEAGPESDVILGAPGSGDTRTAVDEAIADGRLGGIEVVDLPRIALATADGVAFIDPGTAATSSTIPIEGGAHGLALVTDLDDPKLYVAAGIPTDPGYVIVTVGGDAAADGPVKAGTHPLPGPGSAVAYDAATQQVHVLGRVPGATGAAGDPWTVYVIEPHGNAVYADARLPEGFEPTGWAMDVEPEYVADDREQLLVFDGAGQAASIDVGSHAFAWRLPGVIAGALMAMCLYVLARILFRRRLVAVLAGGLIVFDGLLFVQSRIGMNDVYVGLFIIAAYTLFAAIWTGWWRGRGVVLLALPVIGLLLGLALASKWVAAYAIGSMALLLLVRSALGRVVAILGLIAISSVLGYLAIGVPDGQGVGNVLFLAIMVALTLVAVVTSVVHPIAWTDEEMWLALLAPAAVAVAVFFGALGLGQLGTVIPLGPVTLTPLHVAVALAIGSPLVYAAFRIGAAVGYGPLAAPPGPADPARILGPAAPPPTGWLRPGWLVGLPMAWAAVCLVAIPLAVYVVSYLPWAAIENHRLWDGFPAAHTGQTLVELTGQMYGYHNGLTSPHPASSPWWAWPFDLKPVWFYQEGLADGTSAALYGAGNLVIWWFGVPALIFVAIMAFRRRSLALGLIAIAFATQWVSWARIDRAAFQYHYYTALPFVILALAYLVAELWHGASRRTWLAVRAAGALAVAAPALVWLLSRPICAAVGVTIANPGSQACPAIIPDFVLTWRSAGLLAVVAVGALVLGRTIVALQGRPSDGDGSDGLRPAGGASPWRSAMAGVVVTAVGFALVALLPDTSILTLAGVPVEPIALVIAIPLGYFAGQVFAARDARRFVVGLGVAVVAWFAVWYPNIAALPLPSNVVNAYQGLLPTYLYAFQFPVGTASRTTPPLASPMLVILALAIAVTSLVVAYSASAWRLALAESAAARSGRGESAAIGDASGSDSDGLARTGGGA